jgi:hypothetical protein
MEEIMNDPSRTYKAQVREIYSIGTYLAKKKYRFLKLAYILFLSGSLPVFWWCFFQASWGKEVRKNKGVKHER